MAMLQVGMSFVRAVILIGAGAVGGPVVLRNAKFADFFEALQKHIPDKDVNEESLSVLASTVAGLGREVQKLASERSLAVLQVDSGRGAGSALVPAAVVGAVGYCYMWWNGISFSSLMYVTKRNMANAVASMTKHLEQVQSSLAAAKKHLSQRIQYVDDKLELQKEISGQIKDQVTGARIKIKSIGSDMDNIKNMVMGLDQKMDSIEAKQNYSCTAVDYLCQFIEQRVERLPERLEGLQRTVRCLCDNTSSAGLGLLTVELANPSSGRRLLRPTAINPARLILP